MNKFDEVRSELNSYLATEEISASALARSIGVSAGAISSFKKGDYKGDNEGLAKKIKAYLNNQNAKKNAPVEVVEFREDVFKSLDYQMANFAIDEAANEREIALIYGSAGTGKTTILKEYVKANPNAVFIEATPHTSAKSLLDDLAEALKISIPLSLNGKLKAVARHLNSCQRILLIDEAEHLPLKALEDLRRIHDFSRTPLVLVGTEILLQNLMGRNKELRQLYSRIGSKWIMKGLSKDECKEYFSSPKPFAKPCANCGELIYEWCGGNFRSSAKLYKKALRLSEYYKVPLDKEVIAKASEMVVLA
ncbi:AAA family ATPase [Campylobacter hyointestinalis]|uniref:Bacteriocin n=1 Tax=Campylobacter hyointestinalis subsp. hyointestinalis TaxID=91352 RepID=A0A855N6E4_CAMHY|nr:AAA family ATPase [Campylobacter hyointestinalis]PPB58455.1 bacteriocin [Campylobacter hyointestinalis subsp. hyointestinalis]PPB62927.1 bacteriocin [Campylobacter hyointestinalis subsp. hyointestinalis]PPB71308.1 bacteriocin [Campylobacter hyointestinalis subsp. hyointestinalis]